ncbi:CBS and ACT domain-containing protein [uncultured Vagococcus sp.]|uniref:CBS and ACT domain-containing protein n=1 Tax=uncultured Vagococcus sp. TaxID=189676 RepID=UPI0028D5B2C9|nr:CBS and ACT domain-containing protein [uncultured Vagococcus sp.]
MIVENYMSTNLITVTKETKINDAVELMNEHQIHRLPVIENGKMIGLLTEGTIQEAMPSKATSLSVYEATYLLNKTTVADVMIKQVETIEAGALLEDAIYKMRQKNVGVLPVCGGDGKIVGIITNNDIFDAFLEITGYNQDGVRLVIEVQDDHQGILADLAQTFAENNINVIQIVVYRNEKQPTIVVQLANAEEGTIGTILKEKGYNVLSSIKTEAV